MAYLGDKLSGFGDYMNSEYGQQIAGGTGHPKKIDSLQELIKKARSNKSALPAGLQGYTTYPEGYSDYGMEELEASEIVKRNYTAKPAGLQGLDISSASHLVQRNKDALPAGLQGYEMLGEQDQDAFSGYGDGPIFRSGTRLDQENVQEFIEETEDEAFSGLGELETWDSYFNKAATAKTETAVIENLKNAVISVPDDTSPEVKAHYYNMAMKLLNRRKATNLRHLDVKRAELRSGIGWLLNPSLPKTGGFQKAMQDAVGAAGAALSKYTKDHEENEHLMSLGQKLKANLRKLNQLSGFGEGELSTGSNKMLIAAGLGVAAALACWYYKKGKKTKKRRK